MERRSKSKAKPDFKINYSKSLSRYDPILDKNLQYYFANKQNRKVLRQHNIINSKNQIIDKKVSKIAQSGEMELNNGFKIHKKFIGKTIDFNKHSVQKQVSRYASIDRNELLKYIEKEKKKIAQKVPSNEWKQGILPQVRKSAN